MEVKPGYMQTEVGVIPEKWDVKTLGSLTSLLPLGNSLRDKTRLGVMMREQLWLPLFCF